MKLIEPGCFRSYEIIYGQADNIWRLFGIWRGKPKASIVSALNRICRLNVEHECVDGITARHEDILMAAQHIGFRRIRNAPYVRVPQRLPCLRVERDEIPRVIASKQ